MPSLFPALKSRAIAAAALAGIWLAATPFPLFEKLRFLGLAVFIWAAGLALVGRRWSLGLLPLGALTGLAYVMVFGNLLSLLVRPPLSFELLLPGLLLLALAGRRGPDAAATGEAETGSGFLAAAAGCGLLLIVNNIVWLGQYHIDHLSEFFPDIATIAGGNIPFRNPFFPRQPGFYHYGPALVLAVFHSVARIPLEHLFGDLPLLAGVWSILLGARMVYDRTGSRKAAALAFWAMAFAGPLTWILHLSPARTPNILQTIADRGQPAVGLHPVATGYQTYPFGFMLNNLNIVFAVGLALAAAAHCELLLREPGWRKRLNLVVTLAALALSLETAFAAFAAALAFYGLAVKSCRREVLPLILGAGILVLFQGGVVTDWLLSGGDTVPALHRLALRWPPGFPAWGEAMPSLSHPMQLLRFLAADYGLTFWCLPLAALGMLRASSPAVSLLSLCAACGLAVPFFLRYPVADWDMSKFLAVSSFILPVPYACGWWTERKRRWLNEALLALMAASTVGFVLRFAAQARWPVQPPPALVRGVDIPAGAWLRGNVPAGSVFLSDVPLLVVNQGFFALAQVRRHAQVPPFDLAGTLERLDAAELRTLGVDYVYLTRERCAGRALKLQEAGGFGFVRDFDAQRFLFRVLPADHPSRVPSS